MGDGVALKFEQNQSLPWEAQEFPNQRDCIFIRVVRKE
jgi:hypothetical protein